MNPVQRDRNITLRANSKNKRSEVPGNYTGGSVVVGFHLDISLEITLFQLSWDHSALLTSYGFIAFWI